MWRSHQPLNNLVMNETRRVVNLDFHYWSQTNISIKVWGMQVKLYYILSSFALVIFVYGCNSTSSSCPYYDSPSIKTTDPKSTADPKSLGLYCYALFAFTPILSHWDIHQTLRRRGGRSRVVFPSPLRSACLQLFNSFVGAAVAAACIPSPPSPSSSRRRAPAQS